MSNLRWNCKAARPCRAKEQAFHSLRCPLHGCVDLQIVAGIALHSYSRLQRLESARAAICCQGAAVSQEKARIREAMLTKVGEVIQPGANYSGLDFAITVRSKSHLEHVDIMSQTATIKCWCYLVVLSFCLVSQPLCSILTLYHPASSSIIQLGHSIASKDAPQPLGRRPAPQ